MKKISALFGAVLFTLGMSSFSHASVPAGEACTWQGFTGAPGVSVYRSVGPCVHSIKEVYYRMNYNRLWVYSHTVYR